MKILVIDNNTSHMKRILRSLKGQAVEVRKYRPGIDFSCADKDLVILSGGGGEGQEIYDEHLPGQRWYRDEIRFIKQTDKPVLGICMGFEIIGSAYGAPITRTHKTLHGLAQPELTPSGKKYFNKARLQQYEHHDWRLEHLPSGFRALATSKNGVEAFEYITNEKKIIATQFHPEKGGSLNLKKIIQTLAV